MPWDIIKEQAAVRRASRWLKAELFVAAIVSESTPTVFKSLKVRMTI